MHDFSYVITMYYNIFITIKIPKKIKIALSLKSRKCTICPFFKNYLFIGLNGQLNNPGNSIDYPDYVILIIASSI